MNEIKELIAQYVERARSRARVYPAKPLPNVFIIVTDELQKIKAIIEDERKQLISLKKVKYKKKWSSAEKDFFDKELNEQFENLYLSEGKRVIPEGFFKRRENK